MGSDTKIQWTDATFSPWVGCTKISPACDHCYAESWAKRSGAPELWAGQRRRTTAAYWKGPIKWNAAAYASGVRLRVFCASLADVFDNKVPQEWRSDLWHLISVTPWLDWQLLTKRPQLVAEMAPSRIWSGWDHIWLGTTVENQTEAQRRIPHLQASHARLRFLSCEPLLEAIAPDLTGIDWLICGGESGGGARDMEASWARDLQHQAEAAGTAFFMKQMARKAPIPADLLVRQFPPRVPAYQPDER